MIAATELRKNNLFNPISRNGKVHLPQTAVFFEVMEINLFHITAVLKGENPALIAELPVFAYSDIEPIPLTPEILEKAGFVVEDDGISAFWKLIINRAEVISIEDDWSIGLNAANETSNTGYASSANLCKHLHQLQNLYFALTGTELNVNL